jgi:3-hydroxyacyl-CoA dehydrogenase/enoyl-CoA hydratase/3-hydroxybutyryl-CoA epimerase
MEARSSLSANSTILQVDRDDVAWLVFNDRHHTLNLLTRDVLGRLAEGLEEARFLVRAGRVRALVLWSGKEDSFFGGAEVSAIEEIGDQWEGAAIARHGQSVFQALATFPCPTLAAIHGACVGGGLEMSLACHHRVASDARNTQLGFPEVLLGILPAWGGTTRLSRSIGLRRALPLLLTGRRISSTEAEQLGLLDRVLPADGFQEAAAAWARCMAKGEPTPKRMRGKGSRNPASSKSGPQAEGLRFLPALILAMARRQVRRRTGGHYPAPEAILDVLSKSWGRPIEESLEAEADALGRLITSPVSKELIRVFRLRQDARRRGDLPEGEMERTALAAPLRTAQTEAARELLRRGVPKRALRQGAWSFGFVKDPFSGRPLRGMGRARMDSESGETGRRLALPMVSRAAQILEEHETPRAGLLDLALVMDDAFPAFRGGLLHWADEAGLQSVTDGLDILASEVDPVFLPSPALRRLAKAGTTFYERYP